MVTAFGGADGSNTFLPRIWATRKLGYLIDQVRLSDNPAGKKEVIDEIVRISKDYGIITEYTSFLVDENEQAALNLRAGGVAMDGINAPVIREEIARRATQLGTTGAGVTGQSGRAKDLKKADQSFSRYQSANGSVDYFYEGLADKEGKADHWAYGKPAAKGNFGSAPGLSGPAGAPGGAGGGFGGFGGGRGGGAVDRNRLPQKPGEKRESLAEDSRNAITLQVVKDRTFYRQANNMWQDQSYDAKKNRLYQVRAFSDAHFALMKTVPQLGAYSSVGEELIVRIGNNAVQIGKAGKEKLSAAEIKEITGK
jgi:hypothetical protein